MAEPSSQKPFTITIIGGGLAGLLLAVGLTTRGVPIHIYEAAPTFAETSAGIGFGLNAVRVMTMLDPRIRWGGVPELVMELKVDGSEGGGNVLRARFMEEYHDHVGLAFSDGTTEIADAVVGCDGIRSVVRELLLGKDDPASKAVLSGVYCYRGLLNMNVAVSAVGEELALNSQVFMGKDGDLVTLMTDFEEFGDVPKKVLKLLEKGQIWALFDIPDARRYSSRLITLLGDAAHTSTSHAGAGAGVAVEDALVLSELISDTRVNSVHQLPSLVTAYDMVRRPRTQKLVKHSRECGMLFQLRQPAVGGDIMKIKEILKDKQKWIWSIDMEDHLKDARTILNNCLSENSK